MNRLSSCSLILILTLMPLLPAVAHETGIYESLDHIHIGRVFLSPTERVNLDANRNVVVTDAMTVGTTDGPKPEKDDGLAAGYIVSSSGETRVWRDGDFVTAEVPASIRFPGDVEVTRNADSVLESTDAAGRGEASPAAGAADDVD